jgi:hypothetical protein
MPGRFAPIVAARRRKRIAESRVRPWVLALVRLLARPYARLALHLSSIEYRHPERLVEAMRDFQEGRARLLLAFRHPYGDEAQILTQAFGEGLRREAARLGRSLPRAPHARFVHGFEVPLWSGPLVRWILPRMGAVPVYHVKFDSTSVNRLRALIREDEYPLALAPEGQVSYRSETVPRLEAGTAHLAFWCAEELRKAGRGEKVLVLPVSVHCRFDEGEFGTLEDLVSSVEIDCGLPAGGRGGGLPDESRRRALAARLSALDLALIAAAERYYGLGTGRAAPRRERLDALLEAALARAEAVFGFAARGDRIARVYRVRQEGWDRIYPESGLEGLSALERELADRRAGEAWYAMRHMELADLGHYLDAEYLEGASPKGPPSFGRLVETAYSLSDLASRLAGGDISDRPNALRKRAVLVVAPPLDLGARFDDYRRDRKAAIEGAMSDLNCAFISCIEEYLDGKDA